MVPVSGHATFLALTINYLSTREKAENRFNYFGIGFHRVNCHSSCDYRKIPIIIHHHQSQTVSLKKRAKIIFTKKKIKKHFH